MWNQGLSYMCNPENAHMLGNSYFILYLHFSVLKSKRYFLLASSFTFFIEPCWIWKQLFSFSLSSVITELSFYLNLHWKHVSIMYTPSNGGYVKTKPSQPSWEECALFFHIYAPSEAFLSGSVWKCHRVSVDLWQLAGLTPAFFLAKFQK